MTSPQFTGNLFIIEEEPSEVVRDKDTFNIKSRMIDVAEEFLEKKKNLSDIPNRDIARQNLGITISPDKPIRPRNNDIWVDLMDN